MTKYKNYLYHLSFREKKHYVFSYMIKLYREGGLYEYKILFKNYK